MLRKTAILVACFTPTLLIAGNPPSVSASTATTKVAASKPSGSVETLSGKITQVDIKHKLLIVQTSNGVTYNFVVAPSTRIAAGTQAIKAPDLAAKENRPATVRFVPTHHGNIAKSITIE
jgi:hypothetical protein